MGIQGAVGEPECCSLLVNDTTHGDTSHRPGDGRTRAVNGAAKGPGIPAID